MGIRQHVSYFVDIEVSSLLDIEYMIFSCRNAAKEWAATSDEGAPLLDLADSLEKALKESGYIPERIVYKS